MAAVIAAGLISAVLAGHCPGNWINCTRLNCAFYDADAAVVELTIIGDILLLLRYY